MLTRLPARLPYVYSSYGLTVEWRDIRRRALASYLGLAIGDALGATTEFMTPREIQAAHGVHRSITGGGWLNLKPGRVTDDTEMSLALGEVLIQARGMDVKLVAEKYVGWMRSKPVDIGHTVRRGLQRYIDSGSLEAEALEYSAGNGAAMRNLPVVIATLADSGLMKEWSLAQSRLTHNNEESDTGTLIFGDLARLTILMGQNAPLYSTTRGWLDRYPKFDHKRYKQKSDGYIVSTVKSVLHFFFNTYDFESCLVGIVNMGGDADTHGALAGMLAGAFYGLDSIPGRWLKKLDPKIKEAIEKQVGSLLEIFPPL